MRLRHAAGFLCAVLLSTGAAFAAELAPFEEASARAEGRPGSARLSEFPADVKAPERPLPWRAMGLAVLCFAVAAPFALRMYRRTCEEAAEGRAFGRAHGDDGAR